MYYYHISLHFNRKLKIINKKKKQHEGGMATDYILYAQPWEICGDINPNNQRKLLFKFLYHYIINIKKKSL